MNLEAMKKKMELSRVRTAREELELKIAINEHENERLRENIAIQVAKEEELAATIAELSKK